MKEKKEQKTLGGEISPRIIFNYSIFDFMWSKDETV